MHIRQIHARDFRRFSDLTIELPTSPRLVVLAGPNGIGKSSLFDALRIWHGMRGGGWNSDNTYWVKGGLRDITLEDVSVTFHETDNLPNGSDELSKAIYIRTAYRNDPDFSIDQIRRAGSLLHAPLGTAQRMIDNDVRVSDNYQRMVALTLEDVYGGQQDERKVGALREQYVSELRDAMQRLFPGLELRGPGDPLGGGTFHFRKGVIDDFVYKNLSGGEKAAFDLLLDLIVKKVAFNDTVFCIDEPDTHLNTRVQGKLLEELLKLINHQSQLWIATHSIGMMRYAQKLQQNSPDEVVFIDFQGSDFDTPTTLNPVQPNRRFWTTTLDVALGDLADLVAPSRVVLCEGRVAGTDTARAGFDARCYSNIFGDEMPDTEFVSVGNNLEVATDHLRIGAAISTIVSGTKVIRVIDRDHLSPQEVTDRKAEGIRVLSRRHLEAFLLDDEVLTALCNNVQRPEQNATVLKISQDALAASVARGNDSDDIKSAAGEITTNIRKTLALQQAGNSTEAFLADTLAPLIGPGMTTYEALKVDLFGSH